MRSSSVTILDCGVGNLYSVQRAIEVCGASKICISSDPQVIKYADRLVLPGVGAFANGMQGLHDRGLVQVIHEFANTGRPILGICLGMQMLATVSEEFGEHAGLNLIPGKVVPMPTKDINGFFLKIPSIGWNHLNCPTTINWEGSILELLTTEHAVYLIHSFQFVTDNQDDVLATYQYGGHVITAAVIKENIIGLQFHPEKSGNIGLSILSTFLKK